MYDELKAQLAYEEGKKLTKYKCTEGHWTIGIGHNLDAKPKMRGWVIPDTITDKECDAIFTVDVQDTVEAMAKAYPNIKVLAPARRDALLNMAFQMGSSGVMKFKGMLKALDNQEWKKAEQEALDSLWAKQTPNRAKRVAHQLYTGEYYNVG